MACEAHQVNDQKICGICGLQWDVTDSDPPQCPASAGDFASVGSALARLQLAPSQFLFNSGDRNAVNGDRRYHVVEPPTSAPTQVACRPPRPIAALIPATLAPDVAYAMAKSYEESRAKGCERIGAMHAAYKAFLESLK